MLISVIEKQQVIYLLPKVIQVWFCYGGFSSLFLLLWFYCLFLLLWFLLFCYVFGPLNSHQFIFVVFQHMQWKIHVHWNIFISLHYKYLHNIYIQWLSVMHVLTLIQLCFKHYNIKVLTLNILNSADQYIFPIISDYSKWK